MQVNAPAEGAPAAAGDCWVKSSLSFSNGNCVEVASLSSGEIGVRNSRHPDGAVLKFTRAEWEAFLAGARNGEFDPEA
jgi:Domain of unknown function (DUF397)